MRNAIELASMYLKATKYYVRCTGYFMRASPPATRRTAHGRHDIDQSFATFSKNPTERKRAALSLGPPKKAAGRD